MKQIALILIIIAAIQATLSAPTTNEPQPLATAFMNLVKTLLEDVDYWIARPENTEEDIKTFQEFRAAFANYLNDLESDLSECGINTVGTFHYRSIKKTYRNYENNAKINLLFALYDLDHNRIYRQFRSTERNHEDDTISGHCCKYSRHGECKEH